MGQSVWLRTPFYFNYGYNIHFGKDCSVDKNCNFADDGDINIGDNVVFGPSVVITTAKRPLNPQYRRYLYCEPVTIGSNCWIGANVTIRPGVTIGENCVIEPGSVVTEDIPANTVAEGNPCRVLRELTQTDMSEYRPGCPIEAADLKEIESLEQKNADAKSAMLKSWGATGERSSRERHLIKATADLNEIETMEDDSMKFGSFKDTGPMRYLSTGGGLSAYKQF